MPLRNATQLLPIKAKAPLLSILRLTRWNNPGLPITNTGLSAAAIFRAQPSVLNYFPGPGTYQVCHSVIIQDSAGVTICADSTCQTIQITITPTCFPDSNIYYVMDDWVHATFTDALTNYSNVSIRWVFGDGTTLSGVASPTHTYPHPGNYEACFISARYRAQLRRYPVYL